MIYWISIAALFKGQLKLHRGCHRQQQRQFSNEAGKSKERRLLLSASDVQIQLLQCKPDGTEGRKGSQHRAWVFATYLYSRVHYSCSCYCYLYEWATWVTQVCITWYTVIPLLRRLCSTTLPRGSFIIQPTGYLQVLNQIHACTACSGQKPKFIQTSYESSPRRSYKWYSSAWQNCAIFKPKITNLT